MKHPFRWLSAGLVAVAAIASSLVATSSCNQTPTNVPVRTFERAGRMDILCMQVLSVASQDGGAAGSPIPAIPVAQDLCSPVAAGVDPTTLPYHLLAVVTQTLRGELAVVDLTVGKVVDTSLALPGTNFLPVGQNPTDVVVTPDAQRVFVASADITKPAIYMIPSTNLLGDSEVLAEPSQAAEQVSLPTWPACALPQAPGRMVVVPTGSTTNADGGVTPTYEIVVVMPGNRTDESALIGTIDVASFDAITPGTLPACQITSTIHLAENPAALPTSWTAGPAWPNGQPYSDASVDLFTVEGSGDTSHGVTSSDAGVTGSGPVHVNHQTFEPFDGSVLDQPSTGYKLPLASCPSLARPPGEPPPTFDASALGMTPGAEVHGTGLATDGRYVYVGDDQTPFIHVIDTGGADAGSAPGSLTELAPLVASSIVDPSRVVTTSDLAISPVTRDFKRYLYAVDDQGTVMVYDVTDPTTGPHTPLTRPNYELDPAQPPDRILFNSPVATLTFARHDFPVPGATGPTPTGVLCNPNPNAGPGQGIEYRANGDISVPLGPTRLRGVFGFATLTSGQVIAIDVDDWDAPCRRPVDLTSTTLPSPISIAQPEPSAGDIDPYHAPEAGVSGTSGDGGIQWVTNETMWPIIQPNRVRSANLVEDDTTGTGGLHDPAVVSTPVLLVNGAPVAIVGSTYPVLTAALPETASADCLADGGACTVPPSPNAVAPNVYMAHDVPEVHVADQTWNVVYEGVLPGFDGIQGTLSTTDGYETLTLSNSSVHFCSLGVEDQQLGLQRFAAMQVDDAALAPNGPTLIPIHFDQRVGDYVQFTDDIIGVPNLADAGTTVPDSSDPYWTTHNDCWDSVAGDPTLADDSDGAHRQQVCIDKFGGYGANQNAQRDFPILEAYDDHLVVGRYLYTDPTRPTNGRIVAPRDTSPQDDFKLAMCCFHDQASFHVRTGAEWVALGSVSGYSHHVTADANNRCVQSCDSRTVLLNARVPETAIQAPGQLPANVPQRNSPFALRSPVFSFFLPSPIVTGTAASTSFSVSIRDDTWQFMTRGQYQPSGLSLAGSNTSVIPQSSMFVPPLGAIAIVDASANGLFIIDLNTLSISDGSPFY